MKDSVWEFAWVPVAMFVIIGSVLVTTCAERSGREEGKLRALQHICEQVCLESEADFKVVEEQDCWCVRDLEADQPIAVPAPGISLYGMDEEQK